LIRGYDVGKVNMWVLVPFAMVGALLWTSPLFGVALLVRRLGRRREFPTEPAAAALMPTDAHVVGGDDV